jgi:hypothetical protein
MTKCSIDHCGRNAVARGYCTNHYYALRKHGDPTKLVQKQYHGLTLEDRFWRYVKKEEGCWRWLSYIDPQGYGRLNYNARPMLASRISYLIHFGEVPAGMAVCHKCDNPSCTNPDHLFLGTQADNVADMERKGRARKRGKPGTEHRQAKLTDQDVRDIRAGGASDAANSIKYGVSRATIHAIRVGKTWRHVK